ncbi:MAG: cytochrome P450 [Actinomycetales bacterium]|nr:cytochrome P450 [Actinomycetales bacterium]
MINFNDKDFLVNPYPDLAKLRSAGKPVWHEEAQMFLAGKYDDANAVLRNKSLGRIFKAKEPESEWSTFNWLHADSILDSEPPKHTRLRSLVSKAFNKNIIESQRETINKIVDGLIGDINAKSGNFDLIADFAEPLPVKVIVAMLGFPEEDEYLLRPWSQAIVKMYEVNPSAEVQANAKKAAAEFAAYVQKLADERKVKPGNDLITDLVRVEEQGEKLNAQELIATCVLLLNAGHEASVNGFGNGMVALLERENQFKLLRDNPDALAATAVEEFLRFDAPLHLFERTATADTEIGGVEIKQGQKIASLLGSANRDEAHFANADQMDITRDPNPHIGFGAGIHFCLGGPLARLEMGIALPKLVKAFPNMKIASDPVRRPTFVLRGYESVAISS